MVVRHLYGITMDVFVILLSAKTARVARGVGVAANASHAHGGTHERKSVSRFTIPIVL